MNVPRRNRIDLQVPAEKAIRDAITAVEALGAHVGLTEAVILLDKALGEVSDYVDAHVPPRAIDLVRVRTQQETDEPTP